MQRVMSVINLSSVVLCLQCRIVTHPHSRCICSVCGVRHPHGQGCCRLVFCNQCAETCAVHTFCLCMSCGQQHQTGRSCRVPVMPVRFALGCQNRPDTEQPHHIGDMCKECVHCGARSWLVENLSCCDGGLIILPAFPPAPAALASLLHVGHVRKHLRAYNMSLCMASVGHKSKGLASGAFVLGGKTYHRLGSMHPLAGSDPSFAQIYVLDVQAATDRRLGIFGGDDAVLRRAVLSQMHALLLSVNPLIQQFVAAARGDIPHLVWRCCDDISTMQIGTLVAASGSRRDIAVQRSAGPLMFIHDGHRLYHPLAYPLLFPCGTDGWHEDMVVVNPEGSIWRPLCGGFRLTPSQ